MLGIFVDLADVELVQLQMERRPLEMTLLVRQTDDSN